ncbi:MAG: hypothetical protein JWM53_1532 [bacterium]|nr:hypothetical protein [bacterium]
MGDLAIDRVQKRLAVYVGPHTARLSLKTFAQKLFGLPPAELPPSALPELIKSLRPLLRSMLGEVDGEKIGKLLLMECER